MMQMYTSIPIKFRNTQYGFSLLELLISIALLGLVVSILYSAFFQISNSSIKVISKLETRQELRLLMKMVLDDLQNVQYLKSFAESGLNTISRRESGLIVENKLGPANFETGEQDEVSTIYFHTAVKARFHPEVKEKDPEIHEVSYKLQENLDTKVWEFIRREDFYIDSNIRKGGKSFVLSESVTSFNLQLLESETALAGGGYKEKWTTEWDSDESMVGGCDDPSIKENFCLPRAIKLTMSIKGHDGNILTDSQVSNFCVPPCNTEIFK